MEHAESSHRSFSFPITSTSTVAVARIGSHVFKIALQAPTRRGGHHLSGLSPLLFLSIVFSPLSVIACRTPVSEIQALADPSRFRLSQSTHTHSDGERLGSPLSTSSLQDSLIPLNDLPLAAALNYSRHPTGVCLVCIYGTPTADMLAPLPPLLLTVVYIWIGYLDDITRGRRGRSERSGVSSLSRLAT